MASATVRAAPLEVAVLDHHHFVAWSIPCWEGLLADGRSSGMALE